MKSSSNLKYRVAAYIALIAIVLAIVFIIFSWFRPTKAFTSFDRSEETEQTTPEKSSEPLGGGNLDRMTTREPSTTQVTEQEAVPGPSDAEEPDLESPADKSPAPQPAPGITFPDPLAN